MLLGDREFDGIELQETIRATNWDYVCRTATSILIFAHEPVFTLGDLPYAISHFVKRPFSLLPILNTPPRLFHPSTLQPML
jgi:hypothetical protein